MEVGGSAGRFGLDGMLPWRLAWSWFATWFALTRHGGLNGVGSFDNFQFPYSFPRFTPSNSGK